MTILFTVACLFALGLVFSVILYFVAQKFKVEEDPRIEQVEKLLPGANCGGCGNAGCRAFAERIVSAESMEGLFCPVGGNEVMNQIAQALGRTAVEGDAKVAVVRCSGSPDCRKRTSVYDGYASCKVMASLYKGDTDCSYGCLGLGDCASACEFGGVSMDPVRHLPIIDTSICVGCGGCAEACPKGVIELRSRGLKERRVYVSCVNRDKGAITRKACTVGCIGCGKCAKVCPFDAIKVEGNVAYIDFTKCRLCRKCVEECPAHAIAAVNFPPKPPVAPVEVQAKEEQQ